MGRLTKHPETVRNAGTAASTNIAGGTTAERPTVGVDDGQMRYNSTNSAMEYTTDGGSTWQQVGAAGLTPIVVDSIAGANGVLTAFTMSQSVANEEDILVFIGGVFQVASTNYTVSTTTITFTSPPPNLESITVVHNLNEVT